MTEIELLASIDAKLGYLLAIVIVLIVIKFLWSIFSNWFFGGV